jgi:hypothetical protein
MLKQCTDIDLVLYIDKFKEEEKGTKLFKRCASHIQGYKGIP